MKGEAFDIYFDCAAELYQVLGAPRLGVVELTASGEQFYRNLSPAFSVISVDSTSTKQLETIFGGAVSSHSALQQLTGINSAERSWIIFGFGKVGRGLAYFCKQNDTQVVVVDISEQQRLAAQALEISAVDPKNREALQAAVAQADIVMTATGIKDMMDVYPREWFNNKILGNVGVYDEYGPQFSPEKVLNQKKPINFILKDLTPMAFIDPEFYLHNLAGLALKQNILDHGVHTLPPEIDQPVISRWCTLHSFSLETISKWFIKDFPAPSRQLKAFYQTQNDLLALTCKPSEL